MDKVRRYTNRLRFEFWRLRESLRDVLCGKRYRQRVFAKTYSQNLWGDSESRSGTGSSLVAAATLRRELPVLFRRIGVRSLLDAGCGDFIWMREIVTELDQYVGVDIVPELIERNIASYGTDRVRFACADITADRLFRADMILCRDCFIHLPTRLIGDALRNFKATDSRYLLLTNDTSAGEYHDIPVGSFRSINFTQPPFSFSQPEFCLNEDSEGNRQLCLWTLEEIPDRVRA